MTTVEYQPYKGSFEVRLDTGAHDLTVRGPTAPGTAPEIYGSANILANATLLALVLSFAENEFAHRRTRSAEKKKSHRKAADSSREGAISLADLVARLGDRRISAWCSGCFEQTEHVQVVGTAATRRSYLCSSCGVPTVTCTVPTCSHQATLKLTSRISLPYCAEHRHEIPGFDKLNSTIETLNDYKMFLKHEVRNAARITMVAGGTIGAAALIAPVAFFAAPAIGAALGSSFLGGSLTGAAATSHGLAMLGGGSLAAGGLGMAGGTAVVTATGTAMGGALGAATVSAYAGADPSFEIELVRSGTGNPVVFATGFLSEGRSAWADWERLVDTRYPDRPVYQVHWGAKELKDLATLMLTHSGKEAVKALLTQSARRGSKSFAFPGLAWVLGIHGVATNPWTLARTRASMTGVMLAELIARSMEGPYVLMGHSLGARVMSTAALSLASKPGATRLESMHLLGAAVPRTVDVRCFERSVSGTVWNYWSAEDNVLKWLYRLGEIGETAAGSSGFGTKLPQVKDRNVTRLVAGHSHYVSSVTLAETKK